MKVLFLSHSPPLSIFRVGSHHLAREFGRRCSSVAHVSTPVSLAHLARVTDPSMRARLRHAARPWSEDGVLHAVARAPLPLWVGPRAIAAINDAYCARDLVRMLDTNDFGPVDVALVDQPLFEGVLRAMGRRPRLVVYRPTDVHTSQRLRSAEARLIERADAFVPSSPHSIDAMGIDTGAVPTMVLENGVEFERFDVASAKPRERMMVYVGAIDSRFDWDIVLQLARAYPSVPIKLAGPISGSPPPLPANVKLLGPVPYSEVPALLATARVGLLPLTANELNLSRSPMKYFEYLAAGLRVLASSTPTLQARTQAPGVQLFFSAGEAVAAALELLELDSPNHDGVEFAREYSWDRRATKLFEFLDGL